MKHCLHKSHFHSNQAAFYWSMQWICLDRFGKCEQSIWKWFALTRNFRLCRFLL